MRKISFLLLVVMVALAFMQAIPAAASTPMDVSGTLYYTPFLAAEPKIAGGNTFLKTYENSRWEGSFEGVSYDECNVVIHRSGLWVYNSIAYFEGTIGGQTGTLTMRLTGSRPDALSDWTGSWVILSGADGLENLHGQGVFSGPGAPDLGLEGAIAYEGQVHFDPAD